MSSEQREVDGVTKLSVAFLDWIYTENMEKEIRPIERSLYINYIFFTAFFIMAYLCITGNLPENLYYPYIFGIPRALFWSFVGMIYSLLCMTVYEKVFERKMKKIKGRMKVWGRILQKFSDAVRKDKKLYMKIREEFPEFFSEVEKNLHEED